MVRVFLVAFLAASAVPAATPRAYVSLAALSGAVGYHHWEGRTQGSGTSWLGFGMQALEGTWFLNQRLGLGLRVIEGGGSPVIGDTAGPYAIIDAMPLLTASWVLNQDRRGFGYLCLGLTPWQQAVNVDSSDSFSSVATLDYGYVPLPPWPVEGRVRLTATAQEWSSRTLAWQASVGVRVGLGWWFMRRTPAAQM